MSERKHKSGYDLMKEKYATLEAKNAELQKEKEILVQTAQDNYCRAEKERDEWKAKFEEQRSLFDKLYITSRDMKDRIDFLLDHCPFYVRWTYRRQFKEGE